MCSSDLGGHVIGATDSQAAYVTDRPVTPGDMSATVLKLLGIDPDIVVHTPVGRPVQLANGGSMKIVAGTVHGATGPVETTSPMTYALSATNASGETFGHVP